MREPATLGFRINIAADDAVPRRVRHFSGYHPDQAGAVLKDCPCCTRQMFPALNLDFSDSSLASLNLWSLPFLNVLFCPSCGFYMKPYWLRYVDKEIEVLGGDRSSDEILQNVEAPDRIRSISLRQLTHDDDPSSEIVIRGYRSRSREEGVYHQIGGKPFRGRDEELDCPECGMAMQFAGVLDSDDLNVPLYEDEHSPVALIVGDGDCMNFYTCQRCHVIGLLWITN